MQNYQPIIPISYDYLFNNVMEKILAERLVNYILFDLKPSITPAIWQDAEIYIRYKKRDVWSLSDEQLSNAKFAIYIYQIKYIITHLTKTEILTTLNRFFSQPKDEKHLKSLLQLLEAKLHIPITSLFLTQEKITLRKDTIKNFDKVFEYPCWVDFTDEANEIIFNKILDNKLTDEQIDYFLGASDTIRYYDQWFKVIKHILATTNNLHVFWTAGDILSIIWKAVPEDSESQKWFKDQIFEIFWPRINSIWPLLNEDKIDFEKDESTKILRDAINWLYTLDDLKDRLPEFTEDYEVFEHDTDAADFDYDKKILLNGINSGTKPINELVQLFFSLSDHASTSSHISVLQKIARDNLIPLIKSSEDITNTPDTLGMIEKAINHAKSYLADLTRERENLALKLIK